VNTGEPLTYLIANHNHAEFIGQCLASLRAQTDTNWLALVGDDASTDDSLDRIRSFADPRVRVIVNERNIGYASTLAALIDEAVTDVVAVLDADDALEPDATAELRRAHRDHPEAALVYSRYILYDREMSSTLGVYGGAVPPRGTAIIDGPVGAIRSFRRRAYRQTSGLDARLAYAEDRDLVYKLEEVGPLWFADAALYKYRETPGSQSRDPHKREIGLVNTRLARRAALDRRSVRGVARLAAECAIRCDYVSDSMRYPAPLRAVASWGAAAGARMWRALGAAPPR
jgi:GT2 family glycosyltransferase